MKKIAALILAGLTLSACGVNSTPTTTVTPMETPTPTSTSETMMPTKSVIMTAQSGSQQPGEAIFADLGGGKTNVVITLTGKASDVAQPAHIHIGSCPTPGAVKYPLSDVIDGRSETIVEASMSGLFESEAMAVNVHKSAEESSVFVSCGDLK